MKKNYWTLALAMGLLSLSLSACGGSSNEAQKNQAPEEEVTQVTVSPAVRDTVEIYADYTTTLSPKAKNNISAQTGGRLSALYVQVGDRVRAGQTVARLDATQLEQVKVQLEDAKLNLSRMQALFNIGGVSQAQLDQAQSAVNMAQIAYRNLSTNTTLVSPISGVVTAKNYDVGDMTSPSLPVVVIEQITPVQARINVSEANYQALSQKQSVSLTVPALADEAFPAYIDKVHPTIDSRTHTVVVEVEVSNKDERLRPGMFGRVRLDLGKKEVLLVPDVAIQRMMGSGQKYVYIYEDGKAVYKPVELGQLHGNRYEILSGIDAGASVIVTGLAGLKNGSKVSL